MRCLMPLLTVTLLVLGALVASCRSQGDAAAPPNAAQLRVMTFNIRYGTAKDGDHAWPHRRALVAERIHASAPDVLALQEGLAFQLEELAEVLRDYRKVGQHREGGLAGEFSGLYVRNGLEVLNTGEFWFSETPEVPGSRSWDSSLPRMCAWADVALAPGAPAIRLYGTHYDHRGAVARKRSTELVLEHSRGAERVVVMGDLNAREGDAPVAGYLDAGFRSAVLVADPDVTRGTMNAFRHEDGGRGRIDHVLVRGPLTVTSASILGGRMNGLFPSDHDAVIATLELGR